MDRATLTAHQGQDQAKRAQASDAGHALARAGLVARGVVYLLLGYLTADIVASSPGANASTQGALDELVHQPAGPALVVLLAVGFAGYGAWRLLQAVAGGTGEDGKKDLAIRVGWAAIGVVYLFLCVRAVLVVTAGTSSSSNSTFSLSRDLLGVTGGRPLLGALGAGVVIGGLVLAGWGVAQKFAEKLAESEMPRWLRLANRVLETFGNVTRGLAFAAIGGSLIDAAVNGSPQDAKGMNASLHGLLGHPYGQPLLLLAAAGFIAFGLASLVEARYRKL